MSSDLPSTPDESKPTKHPALFSLAGKAVRSRIVGGLMFILPLVITFYILVRCRTWPNVSMKWRFSWP